MICNVCGKENPAGMRFCSGCGSALPVAQQPVSAPVQPVAPAQPPVQPAFQAIPNAKTKASAIDLSVILAGASVIGSFFVVHVILQPILEFLFNEILYFFNGGWCLRDLILIIAQVVIVVGLSIPVCKELKDKIAFVSISFAGESIGYVAYCFLGVMFGGLIDGGFLFYLVKYSFGAVIAASLWYVYKNGINTKK